MKEIIIGSREIWEFKYLKEGIEQQFTVIGTKEEVLNYHKELKHKPGINWVGNPYKLK